MIKKPKLKLGEEGYESEFVSIVTNAIMEMVERKMDDINTGLHVILEKRLDDFRVYGDMISDTNDTVKRLSEKVDRIEIKLDNLENTVGDLEEVVSDIKGDVGKIKTYIFDNVEPRMHVLEIRDKVI